MLNYIQAQGKIEKERRPFNDMTSIVHACMRASERMCVRECACGQGVGWGRGVDVGVI